MKPGACLLVPILLVVVACSAAPEASISPEPTGSPAMESPTASETPALSESAGVTPRAGVTPPADCINPPPDLKTIIDQAEWVACYGAASLTIDAYWADAGVVDCPATIEPAWLFCSYDAALYPPLFGAPLSKTAQSLLVTIDPASGIARDSYFDTDVRVTGHFDDPAAQSCEITDDPNDYIESAIEACRSTFVVTEVVPLVP